MRFQKTPLYYIQYLALRVLCFFFRLLPYRLAVATGRCATGGLRFILLGRFKRTLSDIKRAFPDKTDGEVYQIALESWRNMGAIMAEFLKLTVMSTEQIKEKVEVRNADKMLKAQEDGKGAIIHIGHFTNWEAFGLAGAAWGIDKAVLAQRMNNPYVDEYVQKLRNKLGGRTLYSNHQDRPFFAILRWLKKGKIIGILTDQNVVSGEIFLPFLGRIAAFSPITALVSIKMQVPVLPVQVTREKNKIVVTILGPVYPPKDYSNENVEAFSKELFKYYEDWIKQNPATWLWAHNRWKREAEGEAVLKAQAEHAKK